MTAPRSMTVFGFPLISWNPRPWTFVPPIAAMSGLMMLFVTLATTAVNAAPMTTATARSTTLPRMMKFLKPWITSAPSGPVDVLEPGNTRGRRSAGPAGPRVDQGRSGRADARGSRDRHGHRDRQRPRSGCRRDPARVRRWHGDQHDTVEAVGAAGATEQAGHPRGGHAGAGAAGGRRAAARRLWHGQDDGVRREHLTLEPCSGDAAPGVRGGTGQHLRVRAGPQQEQPGGVREPDGDRDEVGLTSGPRPGSGWESGDRRRVSGGGGGRAGPRPGPPGGGA